MVSCFLAERYDLETNLSRQNAEPPQPERLQQPTYYDLAPPPPTPCSKPDALHVFDRSRIAIYSRIAENIGRKWRDLGRELDVDEGALDRIEEEHRNGNTADKVYAVFARFGERTLGAGRQVQALSNALRMVRRRDLELDMQAMLLSDD